MAGLLHIAFDSIYAHPLPEGHRFPMLKYELIPAQLLYEGIITQENLIAPKQCPDGVVLLTHTQEYLDKRFQPANNAALVFRNRRR